MHVDTRRKNQLLFYLDIVLLGLGTVGLVVLVHDAFQAGYASQTSAAMYGEYMARLTVEGAMVLISLAYFLARFYKARVKELANPWG
ncbi:MAG: hypothetical protein R3185_02865 [Candidatus Thermoplasmatota archaeon]|nr:hypothetical protein [Candidatus Thermoplasmatota archaeon]